MSTDNSNLKQSFFRLVRYAIDVAVYAQGLHFRLTSRGLLEHIMLRVEAISEASASTAAHDRDGILEWAIKTQCRCSLRLMESWSSEVYTWDDVSDANKAACLTNVMSEYAPSYASFGALSW